ncbi:HEAT repeat domain-containing protein [Spirulina sp. 06S082]|uniref:HEAT repeat domain-containing protein n=1 Tax=Spirulina sp. 06S082 TaxID=3110248 RepID=UPI002B1FEB5C|nr:HEAT repeat domain-containing protein [Spirulina sp. 06S082]MEA5467485.1 HEAT repeat domain-containing protein [Spirulina sp. 06S082]
MLEILAKAKSATQNNDWLQVNYCLQQLPLTEDGKTPFDEEFLNLALTVLNYGDFQDRWEVAKILPKFGDRVIPPLIEILEDEEIEMEERCFAGSILGQFDRPLAIEALMGCLQTSQDEELTSIAASALANLGESAIATLAQLLQQPESRRLATQALSQIRHPAAIESLLTVVDDENAQIRTIVIETLGTIRDRRFIPILIEALNDLDTNVRKEAVIALGLWRDLTSELDLLTLLTPRLYDLNLEICQQAAIAIGKLKTSEAAATLFHVFQSPVTPISLQLTLIRALAWNETEASLECLHKILSSEDQEKLLETIRVLGRMETPHLKSRATRVLLDFFSSSSPALKSPHILKFLIQAWGQLGEPDAREVLVPLQDHNTPSIRLHAIAALDRCQMASLR